MQVNKFNHEDLKVSVVVSTYSIERFGNVLECIKSLNRQTLLPYEIILVLDPEKELVEFYSSKDFFSTKIVISDEKGLSNARNAGVRSALGDIIAFIDDDAVADKNWLQNLVQNYSEPDFLGAGGLIMPVWDNGRPTWFPEELDWIVGCTYKGLPERKSYVRNPIGCNMSFRKQVFEKIGYFESRIGRLGKRLISSEEAEFSLRLLSKIPNSKIIYDPSAIVYHKVPKSRTSFRYSMKRSYYEGVSKRVMNNLNTYSKATSLLTERKYIDYLMLNSVPSKIKRIYNFRNALHILIIFFITILVLIGYAHD